MRSRKRFRYRNYVGLGSESLNFRINLATKPKPQKKCKLISREGNLECKMVIILKDPFLLCLACHLEL